MHKDLKNYKLSPEFVKKLAEQSVGYISPENFDKIIQLFENEISSHYFTYNSESNLLRIILAMYDKITLLNECLQYPHYVEILVAISTNSNYLTDILVRNPEYFYWIVNPSTLETKLDEKIFTESIKKTVSGFKSFHAKVNALRTLKRKEILRIGVKDILGKADIKDITKELSILAKTIASELIQLCYLEILEKYEIKNLIRKFCLIALGKLGGRELNYSSDIDVIIFYDRNSLIKNKWHYNQILTETIYLFIESASSITSNGYIYRVDFRLRPDGRNSPLCRSINEYLNYYESRGEDWERQMLIKADFIAGSKSLYNSFITYLQPFIFPVTFSSSPLDQIKKLKINIEKNLGSDENIKLIPGGIRDIEFTIQALQLLNGGKYPGLKTSNSLDGINKLSDAKLISEEEANTLKTAYIFYRRVEHYLQLMNDSQTHTIPKEGEILEKLSASLNFKNTLSFNHFVSANRKSVQKIYNSVMGIDHNPNSENKIRSEIKFANKNKAIKNLQYLREGKGLLGQKQFDKASINEFQKIEEDLNNFLITSTNPDLVLQNFVRVIKPLTLPSIWYKEFSDKNFFRSFLYLCEFSQKAIDLFAEDEDLRDFFITRKVFEKISGKNIESLSIKKMLFTLSLQFTLKLISAINISKFLQTYLIRAIQIKVEEYPTLKSLSHEFMIAALGSFGSGEMTFSSDIDLIFVVKDLNSYPEVQKDFQILLTKLKADLKPFDVDCRLRPEGKSSFLVWDLIGFGKYIQNRSRIWELQAYCKMNFIYGNKKIFNSLSKAISLRINNENKVIVKKEIYDMRKKLYPNIINSIHDSFNIKKSPGGLSDIEFIIQSILLTGKNFFLKYRGKNIIKIIELLEKTDKGFHKLDELKANFIFLKNLEFAVQSIFNNTLSVLPASDDKRLMISALLGFDSKEKFQDQLANICKVNHLIFENYLLQKY